MSERMIGSIDCVWMAPLNDDNIVRPAVALSMQVTRAGGVLPNLLTTADRYEPQIERPRQPLSASASSQRSKATSVSGREQQISIFPSAGGSSGSGSYRTDP